MGSLERVGPAVSAGRVSANRPIRDPSGQIVTQDAYDDLTDERDECRATVTHLEAELAELRRRFDIVEKLPHAGHVEVPGEGGDVIQRPVLLKRLVLAALHGDIHEEPADGQ